MWIAAVGGPPAAAITATEVWIASYGGPPPAGANPVWISSVGG